MKEKIMIIEDNRTIRGELCVFFEKNEFTPVETGDFTTVEQVVAAVRKVEPKLILLDINLEEISGFDVCREIRKWSGTPILFVTARERDVDELCAMECGGDDYIRKPYSLAILLAKVKRMLQRAYIFTFKIFSSTKNLFSHKYSISASFATASPLLRKRKYKIFNSFLDNSSTCSR